MDGNQGAEINIQGARTNNLKNISLRIPHHQFIVVTGISGSGKSSLIFDVLAQEGQRRYFETLPSFARQFMGKLNRPDVDLIEGLSPVIAIGQQSSGGHGRSTVGTLTDLYDLLRLLYARTGQSDQPSKLTRALFSFNSASGKCPQCNGIGKEEQIDLQRLVEFPEKTIREGALAPTLPTGYIMYSQVTIDVLNQVCEAEGFHVDIPWNELTDQQREVILYGSEKIKVPFGKHSLESRLKWTGIKAKPREEGFYKGMIPIMSDILRRDRNANILKYVHSVKCKACQGTRLNQAARSVTVKGQPIVALAKLELNALLSWINEQDWDAIAAPIVAKITQQIVVLDDLGLGHLCLERSAKSLSASEIQRIRVANQISVPLSDVLYIFDEPSIGLQREENFRLIAHLKALVQKGNTVIAVEHNLDTISEAEHLIDMGPQAGINGGEILFNGPFSNFLQQEKLKALSPTYRNLTQKIAMKPASNNTASGNALRLLGCHSNNLKNIDVSFQLGKLNVVSGRSGSGKSSLVKNCLHKIVQHHLGIERQLNVPLEKAENLEAIDHLIFIDHSPIGRTPRSNPATYLGISDFIRDAFASLSDSKTKGYTKARFSFNNTGGRCETCQGAGKTQIGMHFLGNVDLLCETCNGDRFNADTLQIKYKNLSIADVYKLSVDDALNFFRADKKIHKGLQLLQDLGLGYLCLGQSSTTLSGGEAQRIKIANHLQKKDTGSTLFIVIEPSIGLHEENIASLLQLFDQIKIRGNTLVCIEQNESIIAHADWHIALGPHSGSAGGELVHQGKPLLKTPVPHAKQPEKPASGNKIMHEIVLRGVRTHGLKNINVCFPKRQLTVVTGLSGSGKSSLVYDSLFAEANARFTESLSAYNRTFIQQNNPAKIESCVALGPAIGMKRKGSKPSKRSTVGTLSGVYDAFRLLFSRIAQHEGEAFTAQHFSFNHHLGACPDCNGLGVQLTCDPDKIIAVPDESILSGALLANKALDYYSNADGQFVATLLEVAKQKKWDLMRPWNSLEQTIQEGILYGVGEQLWEVTWQYVTKTGTGTQVIKAPWLGFCTYIDQEYERRLHNKNTKELEALLHEVTCPTCKGSRLKAELLVPRFLGKNIRELSQMPIASCLALLDQKSSSADKKITAIGSIVIPSVRQALQTLADLGLAHLSLDRAASSLSGGEQQRISIAGQLASHLYGVTYVLDEPSIGLDAAQINVLQKLLRQLIARGNTVVVVEHDESLIRGADYLIEMGPGAGKLGGEVIFQGIPSELKHYPHAVTHQLLHNKSKLLAKKKRVKGQVFGVKGAFANNLKHIDVSFDSSRLTAITGVSGSGKSSLVKDVLFASWNLKRAIACSAVFGLEQFEDVLLLDQQALHQNSFTTPASYAGILEHLMLLFAQTEGAKSLGLKKADFSYQSKKGKCPQCAGLGKLKTSMDFMSDIWLSCDACSGLRYNESVLSCLYKGLSIGAVLQLTIQEAINFFATPEILRQLHILDRVGIGHLQLGQDGNTLSGGEAQRLKLAQALLQKRSGKTLFLFDEPSTGLHYFDLLKLLSVFEALVDEGNTVLFIEHNTVLIERADHLVTLGPGSGDDGGEVHF